MNNIVLMHKECGKKRREDFQNKFDKYILEVGCYIKKEFKEGISSEHMWVKVIALKQKSVVGVLDNEPAVLKNVKFGDAVEVKLNEIEDYLGKN